MRIISCIGLLANIRGRKLCIGDQEFEIVQKFKDLGAVIERKIIQHKPYNTEYNLALRHIMPTYIF
jgi:hypothetical protein